MLKTIHSKQKFHLQKTHLHSAGERDERLRSTEGRMNVFGGGFLLFLIRASKLATLRRQYQGKIDLVWAAP
jgi:hypothetical protein